MNLEKKLQELTKTYFELREIFENSEDEDYDLHEEFSANLKRYREIVPEINFGRIIDGITIPHEDSRPSILIMLEQFHKEILFEVVNRGCSKLI